MKSTFLSALFLCFLDYRIRHGEHCGGVGPGTAKWPTELNTGTLKSLETCKMICQAFDECTGFDVRRSDGICWLYREGPLDRPINLDRFKSNDYDCYEKMGAYRTNPN